MKAFLIFLVLAVVALVAFSVAKGWIHFDKSPNKTTIQIETQEMEEAAEEATEKVKEEGKKLFEKTEDAIGDPAVNAKQPPEQTRSA